MTNIATGSLNQFVAVAKAFKDDQSVVLDNAGNVTKKSFFSIFYSAETNIAKNKAVIRTFLESIGNDAKYKNTLAEAEDYLQNELQNMSKPLTARVIKNVKDHMDKIFYDRILHRMGSDAPQSHDVLQSYKNLLVNSDVKFNIPTGASVGSVDVGRTTILFQETLSNFCNAKVEQMLKQKCAAAKINYSSELLKVVLASDISMPAVYSVFDDNTLTGNLDKLLDELDSRLDARLDFLSKFSAYELKTISTVLGGNNEEMRLNLQVAIIHKCEEAMSGKFMLAENADTSRELIKERAGLPENVGLVHNYHIVNVLERDGIIPYFIADALRTGCKQGRLNLAAIPFQGNGNITWSDEAKNNLNIALKTFLTPNRLETLVFNANDDALSQTHKKLFLYTKGIENTLNHVFEHPEFPNIDVGVFEDAAKNYLDILVDINEANAKKYLKDYTKYQPAFDELFVNINQDVDTDECIRILYEATNLD